MENVELKDRFIDEKTKNRGYIKFITYEIVYILLHAVLVNDARDSWLLRLLPIKHITNHKTRRKNNEKAVCTAAGCGHGSGPGRLRQLRRQGWRRFRLLAELQARV